jgi:hypothetical protein
MKTTEEIKAIWGEDLFETFADHFDEEGWLPAEWPTILERELKDWDEHFRDTHEKSTAYGRMYNIDFEENEDGTKIRRIDTPTH